LGKGGSASVGAVAMWKLRGLDKWLFEGAEAKIFEFLDIEPLMPPGRLRLSKALGRPCMGDIDCHCMAMVSLDEARRVDCEVAGQHGFTMRSCTPWQQHFLRRWRGPARDAPVDLVGVEVVGAEDCEFGDAWYAAHKVRWPCYEMEDEDTLVIHPLLWPLVERHEAFKREWEMQLNRRHLQITDFRIPLVELSGDRCPMCLVRFADA
jgi:hypothetical protein